MKKLLTIILIGFSTTVFANSPVWQVSKGDNTLFIGGSVLMTAEDTTLPGGFGVAYNQASTIVFENDILGASSAEFQDKMTSALTYKKMKLFLIT